MPTDQTALASELLDLIRELGADLAGFARTEDLRYGPSEMLFPAMKDHCLDRYAAQVTTGLPFGAVKWEAYEQTLLVFALRHPEEETQLDWWFGEADPPGNRILADIARRFRETLSKTHPEICVNPHPYPIEKGGVYLKDAAVAAGLGCIGRSNLLITPQYGPRIRLRAIGLSIPLAPTGPIDFDPCAACASPCRSACPRSAFSDQIYTHEETGLAALPGRDGSYYRLACNHEMDENVQSAPLESVPEIAPQPIPVIRYCRACELACPVGK